MQQLAACRCNHWLTNSDHSIILKKNNQLAQIAIGEIPSSEEHAYIYSNDMTINDLFVTVQPGAQTNGFSSQKPHRLTT